jgi:hypothetical protein
MLAKSVKVIQCDGCGGWHDVAGVRHHSCEDLVLCDKCELLWKDPQAFMRKYPTGRWPRRRSRRPTRV